MVLVLLLVVLMLLLLVLLCVLLRGVGVFRGLVCGGGVPRGLVGEWICCLVHWG